MDTIKCASCRRLIEFTDSVYFVENKWYHFECLTFTKNPNDNLTTTIYDNNSKSILGETYFCRATPDSGDHAYKTIAEREQMSKPENFKTLIGLPMDTMLTSHEAQKIIDNNFKPFFGKRLKVKDGNNYTVQEIVDQLEDLDMKIKKAIKDNIN